MDAFGEYNKGIDFGSDAKRPQQQTQTQMRTQNTNPNTNSILSRSYPTHPAVQPPPVMNPPKPRSFSHPPPSPRSASSSSSASPAPPAASVIVTPTIGPGLTQGRVVIEGWLEKKTSAALLFSTFSPRWCVLTPKVLYYCVSRDTRDCIHDKASNIPAVKQILLNKSSYYRWEGDSPQPSNHRLLLVSGGKTFTFRAVEGNEEQQPLVKWKEAIHQCLEQLHSSTAYGH